MLFQKIAAYIVRKSMVERMDADTYFLRGVKEDHLARYRFTLPAIKNKKVLDIACGEGYGTNYLAKTAREVFGVDLDPVSVKLAKEKYHVDNLHFFSSNGLEFLKKHPNYFDVIVCYETIEHLNEPETFIQFLGKSLKKKGLLFISTPNKEFSDLLTGGTANPYHTHEFYPEELENLLQKYFVSSKHFVQRPVSDRHRFLGGIMAVLFGKSVVIPYKKGVSGIGDLFVCTK